MKMFLYYVSHTFVNQLRKLFKTWVLIFLLACFLIGGLIGGFAASMEDKAEQLAEEAPVEETVPETGEEVPNLFERNGLTKDDLFELVAGAVILGMFFLFAFNADKNGSRIFLPADVNLLFSSPMKPQSVLMFRLGMQLGMAVLASLYLVFEIPTLILAFDMSGWEIAGILAAWGLTIVTTLLMQVFLYLFASAYPKVKANYSRILYGILALIAAGYLLTLALSGENYLRAAVHYFNGRFSCLIPFWGWLKGVCVFAMKGKHLWMILCFAAAVIGDALLVLLTWRMKADFYEDAMAKSEETAALLEKAKSEKNNAFTVSGKKKKDRGDGILRDGLNRGAGADMFFFKTLYNRFRFAHFHVLTKTMETYLAAAVIVGLICRFGPGTDSVIPLALTLTALAFYRTMGNPLEEDIKMDWFFLIPESTWAKLFWSLAGSTVCCLLDVLPAVIVGTLVLGGSLPAALCWIPFILSVDFYGTVVGTFIAVSTPSSLGATVKQIIQIMFVYFGLLPDALLLVVGLVTDWLTPASLIAAAVNVGLGLLFFGLTPLFIDPPNGKKAVVAIRNAEAIPAARHIFTRIGLGMTVTLAVWIGLNYLLTFILKQADPGLVKNAWITILLSDGPLYLIAIPLGWLLLRSIPKAEPASPAEPMNFGKLASAMLIAVFFMYAGNLVGTGVTLLTGKLIGRDVVNPVMDLVMEMSVLPRVVFMVILAPVVEELLFRKILIDRMRSCGEVVAVVTSAAMFGLFHGNLSQMFYAFAIGLVFGYVYLRTGKLRYTVGMHMLVNLMGGVVGPLLLSKGMDSLKSSVSPWLFALLGYALLMISLALAGMVLFFIRRRSLRFDNVPTEIPAGSRFRAVWVNPGMLLFFFGCAAMVVRSIIRM